MKKQDEAFNVELSKRLRDYSEEPRAQLWQNIVATTEAQQRQQTPRKGMRTGWLLIFGVITIGALYYFERTNLNVTSSLVTPTTQSNKEGVAVDGNTASITTHDKEESVPRGIAKDKTDNDVEAIGGSAISKEEIKTINEVNKAVNEVNDDNSFSLVKSAVDDEGYDDEFLTVNNSSDEQVTNLEEVTPEKEPVAAVANKKSNSDKPAPVEQSREKLARKKKDSDEVKTVIREDDGKRNKFGIYFTIMPTFGYQRINSNSSDDIVIESISKISTFSTDRLGVRAELGVEDPIAKRIKVFGGLVYFQRKQTIGYTEKQVEYTEVSQGPNGEIVVVPEFKYVEKSFEYELKNLGVQVGVSYELSRKKLLQTLGTGFEFHVALNKLEDEYKAEFTNNPSAYVFYNFYYRLQYPAEGRLKAVFQPTLNYSFYINQNVNAPFYVKPYGLGLNVGFTYNFN